MFRLPMNAKYHNKKILIDNVFFHSLKEGGRYRELKMLQRTNQISNLILQPKFLLQDSFVDYTGKKHQPIYYIADFQYSEGDKIVIEDVKASLTFNTDVYKIKKKLFLKKYPNVVFKEIY